MLPRGLSFVLSACGILLSGSSLAQSPGESTAGVRGTAFRKAALQEAGIVDQLSPHSLEPLHRYWDSIVRSQRRRAGLNVGVAYTALYQQADTTLPGKEKAVAGGDLDIFGRSRLYDPDNPWGGTLAFGLEGRHGYTDLTPAYLAREIGSLWGTTFGFNEQKLSLVWLYWEQGSTKTPFLYRIGRMKPSGIWDRARYVSPNYGFLGAQISSTPAMPLPRAGYGAVFSFHPSAGTYVLAGTHDANGSNTTAGNIEAGEFFTAVELGAMPAQGTPEEGHYHVTLWHTDARRDKGIPSGRGIALHLEQQIGPHGNFAPFARYSYGEGGTTAVHQILSLGFAFKQPFGRGKDVIGFATSWGEPENNALRGQYGLEAFYRIQLTPHMHLTPDIQVIVDPSSNPDEKVVIVGGIRFRIAKI